MCKPPNVIDGARVLYWAWSASTPFGIVSTTDKKHSVNIHGLAICQYSGSDQIYRFSCNAQWETEQDSLYNSVEEAQEQLPDQYRSAPVVWMKCEESA